MKDHLSQGGISEEDFIKAYDPSKWERPSVTVDALVYTVMNREKDNYRKLADKTLNILLIKRGGHPCKGQWALPGGFVGMDESLEDAVERELEEETHVKDIYLEQLYTWGDIDRDKRTRIISVSYLSLVDSSKLNIVADDDASDAAWFEVEYTLVDSSSEVTQEGTIKKNVYELKLIGEDIVLSGQVLFTVALKKTVRKMTMEIMSTDHIAFDHAKIIAYGIERLRNKIEYTDIAFNMMPEKFTLTELQQVYEIILNKKLLKANFRRKIAPMVLETDQYSKNSGHRPSKLYTYNPEWMKI